MKNAYFIPNIQYKAMKKIDPMRVSQSISKNMMKDLKKDDYGNSDPANAPSDIKLANRDQEIMIGEDNNQDEAPPSESKNKEKEEKEPDMSMIEKTDAVVAGEILGEKKSQAVKRPDGNGKDEIRKDTTGAGPMGLDPNAQSTPQSKVPLKTIDQLLIHNSDTAVKPIIGNKDIEKTGELVYNPQSLPFEVWNSDQVSAKIETVEIEGHLHEVYNAMAASGTVNDKLNVLVYFESIILNSNVANRLINSAFMNLLIKLLKNVKSPHLKLRLCSILGQLVRHSTVIGNEVAESGLA